MVAVFAVFITTSVLALFCLAAFESIIRPSLKLRRSRQKNQRWLLAGILTFCILSCAGPALHGSFSVKAVGMSELRPSQAELYHPPALSLPSPVSPSAMVQSTSLTTAEMASSSVIVYRPPTVHMVSTRTDPMKRPLCSAAVGLGAVTVTVWQPHPDTAFHFDAPKAFFTAYIPMSIISSARHLSASNHASGAIVLVSSKTVQVVWSCSLLTTQHPAAILPSTDTSNGVNTSAVATVPLHYNAMRSSILVLVVFATHSIQTAALTPPTPVLPAASSAPRHFDVCYMGSGLHASVSQPPATTVTTPQACGTRQAALFLTYQVNTSTVISSMAQPTALPPGAFNMPGGRAIAFIRSTIWQASPLVVHYVVQPPALLPGSDIMPGSKAPYSTSANILVMSPTATMLRTKAQPPALLPGSYIMPGGRAPSSTTANFGPTATMPHTKAQLPALLPGSYIKLGGEAISNTNMSLPYSRLVPTMTHAMALPSSTCSKLGGRAISSEGAKIQLPHLNSTFGECLFLLL